MLAEGENRVSRIEKREMYTIDLLNGRYVPVKSGPKGVAIVTTAFAVPIIIGITMFGYYLHTRIVTSIQKHRIIQYEAKIGELSEAVERQESFEKERNLIRNCLSEVSGSIGRHAQWSPVLTTLVENMPDSVLLTQLSVKQGSIKRKLPHKDDPKRTITISIPVRTLQISVCGISQLNCDEAVKDFRDRLHSSSLLGPKLESIRVSQEFGTLDGQDVVSYEIDCVFKPGL